MANDPVEVGGPLPAVQNQLLVTLAQAVLVMHQTGYMPTRLREQLARQIGELEALTERYAEPRQVEAQVLPWPPPKRTDPAA